MSKERLEACKCDYQFSRDQCSLYRLRSSDEVYSNANQNPYSCPSGEIFVVIALLLILY